MAIREGGGGGGGGFDYDEDATARRKDFAHASRNNRQPQQFYRRNLDPYLYNYNYHRGSSDGGDAAVGGVGLHMLDLMEGDKVAQEEGEEQAALQGVVVAPPHGGSRPHLLTRPPCCPLVADPYFVCLLLALLVAGTFFLNTAISRHLGRRRRRRRRGRRRAPSHPCIMCVHQGGSWLPSFGFLSQRDPARFSSASAF